MSNVRCLAVGCGDLLTSDEEDRRGTCAGCASAVERLRKMVHRDCADFGRFYGGEVPPAALVGDVIDSFDAMQARAEAAEARAAAGERALDGLRRAVRDHDDAGLTTGSRAVVDAARALVDAAPAATPSAGALDDLRRAVDAVGDYRTAVPRFSAVINAARRLVDAGPAAAPVAGAHCRNCESDAGTVRGELERAGVAAYGDGAKKNEEIPDGERVRMLAADRDAAIARAEALERERNDLDLRRRREIGGLVERLEKVRPLVESAGALRDTRWGPRGDVSEWLRTPDGRNHALVMPVLYALPAAEAALGTVAPVVKEKRGACGSTAGAYACEGAPGHRGEHHAIETGTLASIGWENAGPPDPPKGDPSSIAAGAGVDLSEGLSLDFDVIAREVAKWLLTAAGAR